MPSMRLNTTAVVPKTDESGWQVVGDPKSKPAKAPESKKSKAAEVAPVPPPTAAVSKAPIYVGQFNEGSSAVLAEFDRQWAKQQKKAQKDNLATENAFDVLEVAQKPPKVAKAPPATSSPADSATDSPKQRVVRKAERAKPAKAKKEKPAAPAKKAQAPAVKKEVSVNSLAAEVDVDGFKEFMSSLEAKHPADEVLQLQCVQDFLRSVFATLQLQFAPMLQSMSLQSVADRPWADLPGPLRQAISRFVGSKSSAALSSYLASACDVLVTGLPERGAGGPPAKVEVLVMVAAILRMRPAASLVPACDTLSKGGVRMLAPGRLPTTLWVLEQAARASGGQGVGSAVHAWCRIVLPAIVLSEIPSSLSTKKSNKADKVGGYQLEADSRATAIKYVNGLLASSALQEVASVGLDTRQQDKPKDAVVPAAAVGEVSAVVHGGTRRAGVLRDTPALLRSIEPSLRTLAAATPVQHHIVALVTKCLEASESCTSEALNENASMLLTLLANHPAEAAAAWSSKHKPQIVGSSNVLQHLAQSRALLAPILSTDNGRAQLLELLADISAKQATLAKSTKASSAREAARDAQTAIDRLMASNSVQAGGGSAMLSLLVLLVGAVAVPIIIDRNPELAREHLSGLLGGENTERVLSACKHLVSSCATEIPNALKSLVNQGQDYVRQLVDAAKANK